MTLSPFLIKMLIRIDMMCILCEELDDHPTSQTEFEVNFTSRNLERCAPFFWNWNWFCFPRWQLHVPFMHGGLKIIGPRRQSRWKLVLMKISQLCIWVQVAVEERPIGRQLKIEEMGRCKAIKLTFRNTFSSRHTTQVRDLIYSLFWFIEIVQGVLRSNKDVQNEKFARPGGLEASWTVS